MNPLIVEKTKDYSFFRTIKGNRKFKAAHIKRLKESIEKNPEYTRYNPILVNDKNEVVNGQHRLEALKQLDLPVHYIRADGMGLEAVQVLNANQKPWSPMDYALSYSDMGLKDYDIYIEFKNKYGLNHDTLLVYLSTDDNPITRTVFEEGNMKVKDIERSQKLCDDLIAAAECWDTKKFKKRAYTTAFKKAWETPGYDQGRMIRQLKLYSAKILTNPAYWQDAIRELEKVYNYNQRSDFAFRYNI